jgi:hypothetical protein
LSEARAADSPVVAPTYAFTELVEPVSCKSAPRYLAPPLGARVIDETTGFIFQPHHGGTTTDALVVADPAELAPFVGALPPAAKPEVTPESAATIPSIEAAIPILVTVNFPLFI